MRKRFEVQLELGLPAIEEVILPKNSRDELPPLLKGLQWIFKTPELNEAIFELLEGTVVSNKQSNTGRPGMDLWHILVLGVVRLGLNCDYDRLEHIANYDGLVRQIMGLPALGSEVSFHHKTISDNVCYFDEELLEKINALVVRYGLEHFKKNGKDNPAHRLEVKVDSYVLETNVHDPTDLNLLWDAARKSIEILSSLYEQLGLEGWRKKAYWKRQLKQAMRGCYKVNKNGGPNKSKRLEAAVKDYLEAAYALEAKIHQCIETLQSGEITLSIAESLRLKNALYFHDHLIGHIDLVERRLLRGESIPHKEKVFSLFEPHTELIKKGKANPSVEFGRRLLVSTQQDGLIVDYKVMGSGSETAEVVPLVDRLLAGYGEGSLRSISFDKGFSSQEDRELLELYIPEVVMPKKGRLSHADRERESAPPWRKRKNAHSAVESDINSLEHHGLDRCPDKGFNGYKRYVGLGVLAYNLHKIGARILRNQAAVDPPRRKAA
jgi:hypothetical protein